MTTKRYEGDSPFAMEMFKLSARCIELVPKAFFSNVGLDAPAQAQVDAGLSDTLTVSFSPASRTSALKCLSFVRGGDKTWSAHPVRTAMLMNADWIVTGDTDAFETDMIWLKMHR